MPHPKMLSWFLTASVAGLAGYIDAVAFLSLGGLFVSFMTGNTIRAGVGAVVDSAMALQAGILLLSFVAGVAGGTLLSVTGRLCPAPRVLSLVALLLTSSALFEPNLDATGNGAILAAAMGAINTVFHRDANIGVGLTYMTGSLVKFGQQIVEHMIGKSAFGWVPYLGTWTSFMGGIGLGTLSYLQLDASSVWPAVIFAALLALLAIIIERVAARKSI